MRVLTENGSIGKLDGPGWSPQTALKAKRLLMEFHHMFSLEPNEMGCTDTAEHTIELLTGEDEPFKERFRGSPHTKWRKSDSTSRRCWTEEPSVRPNRPGAMQSY